MSFTPQNERGQASIMIALMLLTFILLFVFVINTGMLVNAKINLQNAADMAAYAGASVQARQLTHISYLNYEMRRQYKKFLFRYYVIGGMAQKSFKGSTTPHRQWFIENPDKDLGVPAICIIWEEKDNFCQVATLKHIEFPKQAILDKVNEALRNQLKRLEDLRNKNCESIGLTNQVILGQWLWNTDPDTRNLLNNLQIDNPGKVVDIVRGITFGLGLIPQELLLKMRMDTLAEYLNVKAQKNVNLSKANAFQNTGDVASQERTIQAFFSAFRSLGNHSFPAEEIVLDELLPSKMVDLIPIRMGFDVYFINFELQTATSGNPGPGGFNAKDCVAYPELILVPDQVPLGVIKNPQILTYYAVRLQAKARILFSPFGDLNLKAYAAAQPFGSRIGPAFGLQAATGGSGGGSFFTRAATSSIPPPAGISPRGIVPNLPVRLDDTLGKGWNQNDVIQTYFSKMQNQSNQVVEVTTENLERAYQFAMAPNPIEAGQYNIPSDLNQDPFLKHFEDSSGRVYAFWAPLISAEREQQGGSATQVLTEAINELLKPETFGALAKNSLFNNKFKQALVESIGKYVDLLRRGSARTNFFENFPHGFNIAQLNDPMTFRNNPSGPFAPIDLPAEFFLNQPNLIKTSWNDVKDADLEAPGRTGYSVKFVSFKTLIQKQGVTSDGATSWTNPPPFDSDDTGLDLGEFIQH